MIPNIVTALLGCRKLAVNLACGQEIFAAFMLFRWPTLYISPLDRCSVLPLKAAEIVALISMTLYKRRLM